MATPAIRAALRQAFEKLVGREPTNNELDNLTNAYDREAGLPSKKAKESLRKYAKVHGQQPSDDSLDRIITDIQNILMGK